MDKQTREKIALTRFSIISPVLMEPARLQNEYFRAQAERKHNFPHYGIKTYSVSAMKSWLRNYRKRGFEGLFPQERSDMGRPRRMNDQMLKTVEILCKAYPSRPTTKIYEELVARDLLGQPPVSYNTLLRVIKAGGWLKSNGTRTDVRKCFETANVNDLWMADFMHGPRVQIGNRYQKAILCAILDDHSRMCVGYGFNSSETVNVFTLVLQEAFETYGICNRLYADNGSAFISEFLSRICALAGVSLIHSKPYDSPSRGKIERFMRTVRNRFLCDVRPEITLDELNQAFRLWLTEDYHVRVHKGTGQRPIDRYNHSAGNVQIRRLAKAQLEEIFLVRHERTVNNDATISFKGAIYEVPGAYIRQRIELRHPADDPQQLYLYDNGVRVAKIKPVDKKENARSFRPKKVPTRISFSKGEIIK